MSASRAERERRFIAAVVKDSTGDNLAECRGLPVEAFEDMACARAWHALRAAPSYEVGATNLDVAGFFAHSTLGVDYAKDRDFLFIDWLQRSGLRALDTWLANLPRERTARGWKPISAFDLCKAPPATPPELFNGLLYRGGTMMLSGASKAHKTYAMLAASVAVAGGHEWLGFRTTAAPVLYLNLELQDFATQHRLEAIVRAMRVGAPSNLHLLNLRGTLVTADAFEARIGNLITQTGAGLVVLDPHYKLSSASGVEENSNDSQAHLLYRLESAVCSRGAALMIAHHFAKGDSSAKKSIDRAAGGGALARWPDVVATLTEHEEADCATAEFALRNFAPVAPFVVRWQHPIWVRDDKLNPAALKKAGRNDEHPADEIVRVLGSERLTRRELQERLGWSESTFRRKLESLLTSRKLACAGGLYSVRDAEPEAA